MKYLLSIPLLCTLIFANDSNQTEIQKTPTVEEHHLLTQSKYHDKILLAKIMIDSLKKNSNLLSLENKTILVVQGEQRNYEKPFYGIVDDYYLALLQKTHKFTILSNDTPLPIIKIVGTPTSLKIQKADKVKIKKKAEMMGADAILIWDVFSFEGKMHMQLKIIDVESNEMLWSYQIDEDTIIKAQNKQKKFLYQYKIPRHSQIIVGTSLLYNKHTITKRSTIKPGTNVDLVDQYFKEFSLEYMTTSLISPQLNFGTIYKYTSSLNSENSISKNAFQLDLRFQLNEYVAPVYDIETGDPIIDTNKQLFSIGISFGPQFISSPDAKSSATSLLTNVYLNSGITENLEINVGFFLNTKDSIILDNDYNYDTSNIDIEPYGININISYKINLDGVL